MKKLLGEERQRITPRSYLLCDESHASPQYLAFERCTRTRPRARECSRYRVQRTFWGHDLNTELRRGAADVGLPSQLFTLNRTH